MSDALAAQIDELQYTLGEGPRWEALKSGAVVSAPNIRTKDGRRWPMLTAALAELTVGVADLYRSSAGPLSEREIATAAAPAGATAARALRVATELAQDDEPRAVGLAAELRREVRQATGMILVQLGVDATEAFLRLKAYSFSSGISIQDVAKDIVQRRLDFRDLPE